MNLIQKYEFAERSGSFESDRNESQIISKLTLLFIIKLIWKWQKRFIIYSLSLNVSNVFNTCYNN